VQITLEITPPATIDRTMRATEHLFMVMHGLKRGQRLIDRLLGHNPQVVAEYVSTRAEGIRYLMHTSKAQANRLEQMLHSYLPAVKIQRIANPSASVGYNQVVSFKQGAHYAFPLAPFTKLEEKDPVAYLTGALTKLNNGEQVCVQLVLSPVKVHEAIMLSRRILGNGDLVQKLQAEHRALLPRIVELFVGAMGHILELFSSSLHSTGKVSVSPYQRQAYDQQQIAKRIKPARTLSSFEEEILSSMHTKLSQPLYEVTIRVAALSDEAQQRLASVASAMDAYTVASYQQLKVRRSLPFMQRYLREAFHDGLPAFRKNRRLILSSSELAALFHFPHIGSSKTDNLITSLSRTLAAPVSLKQDGEFDLMLGRNYHHGIETDIRLTKKERERHVYIIGGTGNGKTTMLQYAIVQDMQAGNGLAVVDPHGDMAEAILRYVPENRMKDVIYFNPDDLLNPIGLNLLELTPGLAGTELMREKDLITESVISIFRKIFSDEDTGGHRIEYILRNTIQTALTVQDATLFTIYHLLNDPKYCKKVVAKLGNPDLVNFWKNELGKAGEMQKVKMSAGITTKVGRFLFSASAKQILEQPKSTIDFDEIINSGKILICNLSKGLIGEDTSELFGITILAKLQLASLRRARIQQADRRPFYLYVDEFQNFATPSFVQMLSEARKYKLFMLMAEQSTSQQDDQQMVSIILANVGTVICFRTGNPEDERLLLPLFQPYIVAGEIANQSAFNFYAKLSAVTAQEPLSGQTLLLAGEGSSETAQEVIRLSRDQYAIKLNDPQHLDIKPEVEPDSGDQMGGLFGVNPDEA
jgi:hypothetical protein